MKQPDTGVQHKAARGIGDDCGHPTAPVPTPSITSSHGFSQEALCRLNSRQRRRVRPRRRVNHQATLQTANVVTSAPDLEAMIAVVRRHGLVTSKCVSGALPREAARRCGSGWGGTDRGHRRGHRKAEVRRAARGGRGRASSCGWTVPRTTGSRAAARAALGPLQRVPREPQGRNANPAQRHGRQRTGRLRDRLPKEMRVLGIDGAVAANKHLPGVHGGLQPALRRGAPAGGGRPTARRCNDAGSWR